jgi:hypothetical protein
MHGVHIKRFFIGTLSFRVQQFSAVLAHVDVSGCFIIFKLISLDFHGAQGFLLEMDLSTMFALEN